jgi:hypothetical protein
MLAICPRGRIRYKTPFPAVLCCRGHVFVAAETCLSAVPQQRPSLLAPLFRSFSCHVTLGFWGRGFVTTFAVASNRWIINECSMRRKQPWPNLGTIPTYTWRNWGKSLQFSVNIAGVAAEIRTQHLPNTCLESYRYANPLCILVYSSGFNVF